MQWFVFSVFLLFILGFMTAQTVLGSTKVQIDVMKLQCPLPIYNGIDNLYLLETGFQVFGNITYNTSVSSNTTGTFYDCQWDAITETPSFSLIFKEYGTMCFSVIPCGYFAFLSDSISITGEKLLAFLSLVSSFFVSALNPFEFEILDTGLVDLPSWGQAFVVGIFVFAYVGVGVGIYKIVNPFGGV